MEQMLSELEDCVPAAATVEQSMEATELSRLISNWLDALPNWEHTVFIRRYWYGEALNSLADKSGIAPGKLAQKMYRLRVSLMAYLEQEGVVL